MQILRLSCNFRIYNYGFFRALTSMLCMHLERLCQKSEHHQIYSDENTRLTLCLCLKFYETRANNLKTAIFCIKMVQNSVFGYLLLSCFNFWCFGRLFQAWICSAITLFVLWVEYHLTSGCSWSLCHHWWNTAFIIWVIFQERICQIFSHISHPSQPNLL